jgi:hypothetical protein
MALASSVIIGAGAVLGINDDDDATTAQQQCLGVRTTKTTETDCHLHLWRLALPAAEAMTMIINAGWATLQLPPVQILLSLLTGLDKDGHTHLAPGYKVRT